MAQGKPFPNWDPGEPGNSLNEIRLWALESAQAQIDWYNSRRRGKKRGSQWMRGLAIVCSALGALCPLFDAAVGKVTWLPLDLGKLGYVFIALGVAFLGYDKYFGLSSGWMRYMLTQMSLEKSVTDFSYDWASLLAQQTKEDARIPGLLQRLKDFSLQVEALVRQETDAWVQEFQSNLAELEKSLRAQAEVRKPGSIKVVVRNARKAEKVLVCLDEAPAKALVGVTETVIEQVSPGVHEVSISAVIGLDQLKDSRVVEVQAGTLVSLDLSLPIPADSGASGEGPPGLSGPAR